MALEMSYDTSFGLTCAEAYWVIREGQIMTQWDEETGVKSVIFAGQIIIYADKAAMTAGKQPVGGGNLSFPLDLGGDADQHNLLKAAYEYIKTLDEFSEAVDC
jgi:hypothetical protein